MNVYYIMTQVANRMPFDLYWSSERRTLGMTGYLHNIEGFIHDVLALWEGFNS